MRKNIKNKDDRKGEISFNINPRSLDPCHIVTYSIKLVKTSWTDSKRL